VTPEDLATIKAACERMIKQDLIPPMMELHPKIILELVEYIYKNEVIKITDGTKHPDCVLPKMYRSLHDPFPLRVDSEGRILLKCLDCNKDWMFNE